MASPSKLNCRSMEVSNKVSEISAIPEVRVKMVTLQQQMGSNGAVMDGRDIGTVVFPEADFKFFSLLILLYAPNAVLMNSKKNENISLDEVMANLAHRDTLIQPVNTAHCAKLPMPLKSTIPSQQRRAN